nr:hypothetical protein [Tanacetum cinerariifolium]
MDQNGVRPQEIFINTKLLNSLQPEWSKYVIMTHQKYVLNDTLYNQLYDHLSQFKPHVNASKAKKVTRNHDLMALVANSNIHSSHSHASPSYSYSPQPYYITHPSSAIDYKDDYQREIQGDAQEDKLTTAMMLLARVITQHEARLHLDEEENNFMLDNAYGDNALEELNAVMIMMACIQPIDKSDEKPTYDVEFIIQNGPLIWPTIDENGVTRPRKYSELTLAEAIQADYDLVDERLLLPPKQTPLEADKNSCTRLLMDLLTQKGYTDERDEIINIVSLRKHSSLDTHINPFNEDETVAPKW